ncbi:DsbE family thiol:disulfide interchange protein [Sutterella massiliensis]|uniref:DsbE family thiol:disulfide interchange protein n=1 Tax=Sutterella massiliensis TaxID=1816689 RepID=A0ABS2DTT0_9BURK|nr:DsbE family thiol:disulfide interchange protein [Sutterella massiliensis]MBM6704726.1 DsbE family thiol:disulfide interchange protein [Sutterella massiliensis]
MLKAKFLIPFAIFVVLAGFLFKGLYMDPRTLPSVLIDKPLPAFELPTVFDPNVKFKSEDMKGKVWMLNVWSSWCVPCKQEHPYLVSLKRGGLKTPIVGFLYKDQLGAGRQVLEESGNPYDQVIFEEKNKVGIDLGVTGVPETFIIDKKGIIRAKVSYPILDDLWNDQVKPLLQKLEAEQ